MSRIVFLTGIGIGASLLAYALLRIDMVTLRAVLTNTDMTAFVFAHIVLAAAFVAKAIRWSAILASSALIKWRSLAYPVVVGNAGNAVIPHSGELLRSAMVHEKCGVGYTPLLTSIAVERMFDFLSVGALALSVFIDTELVGPLASALQFIAAGFMILLTCFLLIIFKPSLCRRILHGAFRYLPDGFNVAIEREFLAVNDTLSALRSSHTLLRIIALSLLQWVLIGASIYLSIRAVGANVPIAVASGVLLLTVAGLTLPTAPGYVGTLQVCFLLGMTGYATEQEAFAASLLYNFVVTVPVILAALPALVSLRLWALWKEKQT